MDRGFSHNKRRAVILFDLYAFADYSGSLRPAEQRRKIAWSLLEANGDRAPCAEIGWTRETLFNEVQQLLDGASKSGKRVIFGFDHNYSFPEGFYEAVTGRSWTRWPEMLTLLAEGTSELPALNLHNPRLWAKKANELIGERFNFEGGGPFWGPHFDPMKKPAFPYGEFLPRQHSYVADDLIRATKVSPKSLAKARSSLKERRLIEELFPQMKAIFQLGGAGSVGLQSLLGMVYLHRLVSFCSEKGIPLHCWPYDGWEVPETGHVLVEMYPTMFNKGPRTDRNDAKACTVWLAEQDQMGKMNWWFHPDLTEKEKQLALLEGWCLGYDKIKGGYQVKGGRYHGTNAGGNDH